jgi:hypothetical protein
MKQKFIIIANSIAHKRDIEIYKADYTDSELSNKEIKEALADTVSTLAKDQLNSLILTVTDADALFVYLLTNK